MDLIEPRAREELAAALRDASRDGRRLLVVGGRTHLDKGNPTAVDAELSTAGLDRLVAYEPADMVCVVEAGMRFGDLDRALADRGQEWAVDARPEATVGGIIAAAPSSPRRLRVGAVRDSVLEVVVATGDGRLVRGGGRTVKNVTGYDLPRLLTGSLGTLGVIVQAALKVRPRPQARRTVTAPGGIEAARALLDTVPLPTGVLAKPGEVELRLEGWAEDVAEQTRIARSAMDDATVLDDAPFPASAPWTRHPVVVEAAVPPSRLPALADAAGQAWGALLGVGVLWAGLPAPDGPLEALRARAAELGGVAPVIRGPGGLGAAPSALQVHRRLKAAFDPAGVLAPGRFWGGL